MSGDKEFDLELENDILRNQLSGIQQDMKRWVEAIEVDGDNLMRPKSINHAMNMLEGFFHLRGLETGITEAHPCGAGWAELRVRVRGLPDAR